MNLNIAILAVTIFALFIILGPSAYASLVELPTSETSDSSSSSLSSNNTSGCVTFDSEERMITVTCKTTDLTQIESALKDPSVLQRDGSIEKGWILNSGITVAQNAILYINSSDTSWLKILGDGETAYPILISGSLKIDSAKISSWNPNTNNYTSSLDSHRNGEDVEIGTPRPYIIVNDDATGTTDITNSELVSLGYESGYGGGRTGLRYEGGDGSEIKGNNIHDMYFGFYSKGVGGIMIEDNFVQNNIHYGLDPHTGTHDMTIRNNSVHDNGSIGIICSLDCYNIAVEDNTVYDNTKMGIMLSRNMTDSIVKNNNVSNEDRGIVISESSNNEIYNNTISMSVSGIDLDEDSFDNIIHSNTIVDIDDPEGALGVEEGAETENIIYSNLLRNSTNGQEISLEQGSNATSDSDLEDEDDEDDNSSENN